ncbi:hypothetical protein [Flavobacterium sp.]|uniref:hypothetical protein n=1 Tax=Flavobacterium sp. TaxID=239 RepID=UPI00262DACAB|nr:hypothetical protein [Flavobacterium sp.]
MLDNFVEIRRMLVDVSVTRSVIIGELTYQDSISQKLQSLEDNELIDNVATHVQRSVDLRDLQAGQNVVIKLYPMMLKGCFYYESSDELIRHFSNSEPTAPYYIHELEYFSEHSEHPVFIRNYISTVNLIQFLITVSDYQKPIANWSELFFLQEKHLILPIHYDASSLNSLDGVSDLINHVLSSVDKEVRKELFVNELILLLSNNDKSERFKKLLNRFSDLNTSYKNSYSLYIEKYSFNKIKAEVDKELLDYMKKIQSVINDAQTKLISIPVAFILLTAQFDITGEETPKNIFLLIGALVFGVLLEVLIRNQYSALSFLNKDITEFKRRISNNQLKLETDKMFIDIFNVHKKQKQYLNLIRFLIWFVPSVVLIAVVYTVAKNNIDFTVLKYFYKTFVVRGF